jgi:hypothetical protein
VEGVVIETKRKIKKDGIFVLLLGFLLMLLLQCSCCPVLIAANFALVTLLLWRSSSVGMQSDSAVIVNALGIASEASDSEQRNSFAGAGLLPKTSPFPGLAFSFASVGSARAVI